MPKHILIIGGGVIGLCTAYYCARHGHRVTVIERGGEQRDGCSFGNAGMIVPSHFVPLAAPGMVALGLKWMWNPESPFYIKPRVDLGFLRWGWKFFRAANDAQVQRSAPLLRDLHLASRACFEELAELSNNDFGLVRKGLLMLCKTTHALEEEAKTAEWAQRLGVPAEVLNQKQTAKLDPQIRMDFARNCCARSVVVRACRRQERASRSPPGLRTRRMRGRSCPLCGSPRRASGRKAPAPLRLSVNQSYWNACYNRRRNVRGSGA